ncbi:hypothetical protein M3196_00165 [Fictibacillus nanhaiensis]|uniref:hypothetical protein n=1 Tax=Fictibacillus nanhaiensis TaxID=742169 RepID=UPI00203B2031|nr:hypothetical protein [Fictibacillus nanhaiensis]MCM3730083.1 hypothetical protein [Fictibacillus nanhaiensis]
MAETFRQRMVRMYAWAIYIDGTRTFAGTATTYHEEIKQYTAANFTKEQIDNALAKGFITQQEFEETLAYTAIVVTE